MESKKIAQMFFLCANVAYLCRRFYQQIGKMRKSFLAAMLFAATATVAEAGGYLTNSNQSVSFLRNPARDAYIAIDGAYSNPAGLGFLGEGWHFAFDWQSAYQTRTAESYFPYFSQGVVNGTANASDNIRKFEGKATAPVIPSFDLCRVGKRWFASFHFGVTGGGGKCTFDNGLGSFESQVAMLPSIINVISPGAVQGYSIDTYMQGRQYYFGGQFGVGYKITPDFNVSVGGRVIYANCNYYGYVRNINVTLYNGQSMSAATLLESQGLSDFTSLVEDKELNCDQGGWGFTPVVGADYRIGKVNLAAKYEFKTRLRLKNKSGVNTSGLAEYDDGKKIAADIPAILTFGAKYDVVDNVRLSAGFHYYFDKKATQYEHKEKNLKGGGWEVLAGAEVDITPRWTVSAGWQTTNYGLGKNSKFLSDMSFVTNSNSVGVGARFQLRKKVALNIAYFKTLYKHYKKEMDDYDGIKEKFSTLLSPLATQLTAGKAQLEAALQSSSLSDEAKAAYQARLGVVNNELSAAQAIGTGLAGMNTAGYDKFHRTNDVFGLGLEIDF